MFADRFTIVHILLHLGMDIFYFDMDALEAERNAHSARQMDRVKVACSAKLRIGCDALNLWRT